jgi:hypothetical protein
VCVCVCLSLSLFLSVSTVYFRFLDCCWLQHLPSQFCFLLACIGNFYTQIIVCTGSSSRRRRIMLSMAPAAGGSCT